MDHIWLSKLFKEWIICSLDTWLASLALENMCGCNIQSQSLGLTWSVTVTPECGAITHKLCCAPLHIVCGKALTPYKTKSNVNKVSKFFINESKCEYLPLSHWRREQFPQSGTTNLVVADFYMLLHHDPCDRLGQRGRGEGAVVRPVIISVGGQQAGGVKLGELHHTALRGPQEGKAHTLEIKRCTSLKTFEEETWVDQDLTAVFP